MKEDHTWPTLALADSRFSSYMRVAAFIPRLAGAGGRNPPPDDGARPKLFRWLILAIAATALGFGAEAYQPKKPDPITETWRWTHLEQFDPRGFRCLAQAGDGSVWLGFDQSLVHFDGIKEVIYNEEFGLSSPPLRSVLVGRDGIVYAMTRTHFLRLEGRRWTSIAAVDNTAVPGNRLWEGPDGAIWALTPNELLCLRGTTLTRSGDLPAPLSHGTIDRSNTLWLVPQRGGLVWECPVRDGRLVPVAERTAHRVFPARSSGQFTALATRDGAVWVVSDNENIMPARFDPNTRRWHPLDLEAMGGTQCNYDLAECPDGAVLIAGRGRLQYVRPEGTTVYTQTHLPMLPFYRYQIAIGPERVLWLCGVGGYVIRIDVSDAQWTSYHDLGFQCQGGDGAEWFVSRDNHVVAHRRDNGTWTKFTEADGMMDRPVAVIATRRGEVWAAGSHADRAAVARYDGKGRWTMERHATFARGIARQSLYEADNGDLWFGAEFDRSVSAGCTGGLLHYRLMSDGVGNAVAGSRWQVETVSPPQVPFRIISLAEDDAGTLWMGGAELRRWKEGRALDTDFPSQANAPRFVHVARGADRSLWVAEWGGGVYRFAKGRWTHFTTADGLGTDFVAGVAANPSGEMWAASPGTTSRFDGTRWVRSALPPEFGLDLGPSHLRTGLDNSLWIVTNVAGWYEPRRAGARNGAGITARGGMIGASGNGAGAAREEDARAGFYLRSFRYKPESHPPLVQLETHPAEVAHNQPAVFLWSGLDRWSATPPDLLQYSHRIDGGAWTPYTTGKSVSLSGLSAGMHRLEVRARDRDLNVSPRPALATFAVLPPVWRQPWFLGLVGGFLAVIAALVAWIVRLRIRHMWQLGEMKLQFFANLSHELRTPLTVILGPLDHMIEEAGDAKARSRLEIVRCNAAHMLKLVDQILDFRRLQVHALPPTFEATEVVAFLRAQQERFRPYGEDKALALSFESTIAELHALVDRDKLLKIADNLVSNAIKYTPPGGEVAVRLAVETGGRAAEEARDVRAEKKEKTTLRFEVTDSGIGIPKAEQTHIFELFFRAPNAQQARAPGSGLGLAFTRELVERCGGTIRVESPAHPTARPERGTRFIVELPVEIAAHEDKKPEPAEAAAPISTETKQEEVEHSEGGDAAEAPTVLVVEDNPDIRRLIAEELSPHYTVLEAEDGLRGLALAEEHLPACIVADVLMPGLDGMTLCSRVKGAELTGHIPVILLTARTSNESQLQGLEAGADDYLAKPVSFAVLKARVQNAIASRARLRERFSRQVYLAPKDVAITPANEQFIRRALDIVEQHMIDENFDVDTFARAMGLSRASLFRKFKAISGQTPSDFIRDLRLERARQLLASGQFNVSQTAAAVGFLDLSHFASCFRKKFGMTPSAFAAEKRGASGGSEGGTNGGPGARVEPDTKA